MTKIPEGVRLVLDALAERLPDRVSVSIAEYAKATGQDTKQVAQMCREPRRA